MIIQPGKQAKTSSKAAKEAAKSRRRTAVKAVVVAVWLVALLPLAMLAYSATQKNIPISLASLLPEKRQVIFDERVQPGIDANVPVKQFFITNSTVTIMPSHNLPPGWLNVTFIEEGWNAWASSVNVSPGRKTILNIEDFSYTPPPWKSAGLLPIDRASIRYTPYTAYTAENQSYSIKIAFSQRKKNYIYISNSTFIPSIDAFRAMKSQNDSFKVVLLGDSMITGVSSCIVLNASEKASAILNELLNRQGDHGINEHEVLNFGLGGYNTEMEVDLYQDIASGHQPNLIILYFYHNDEFDVKSQHRIMNELAKSEKYLALYDYFQNKAQFNELLQNEAYMKEKTLSNYSMADVELQLYRLKSLANGTPIAIISLYETTPEQDSALEKFSQKNNVPYLNLNHILTKWGEKRIYSCASSSNVDPHPSRLAHQLIAEETYKFIIENNLTAGIGQ